MAGHGKKKCVPSKSVPPTSMDRFVMGDPSKSEAGLRWHDFEATCLGRTALEYAESKVGIDEDVLALVREHSKERK